jgi:hypothetical protein
LKTYPLATLSVERSFDALAYRSKSVKLPSHVFAAQKSVKKSVKLPSHVLETKKSDTDTSKFRVPAVFPTASDIFLSRRTAGTKSERRQKVHLCVNAAEPICGRLLAVRTRVLTQKYCFASFDIARKHAHSHSHSARSLSLSALDTDVRCRRYSNLRQNSDNDFFVDSNVLIGANPTTCEFTTSTPAL